MLTNSHDVHHSIIPTRLTKVLLVAISQLLRSRPDDQMEVSGNGHRSKRGKKRAREYEGDEVFKLSRDVLFTSQADGGALLLAFDGRMVQRQDLLTVCLWSLSVLQQVLRNDFVSHTTRSMTSRILLAIQLSLPSISAYQLSPDITLHSKITRKIQSINIDLGAGTSSALSKALPLIIYGLQEQVPYDTVSAFIILLRRILTMLSSAPLTFFSILACHRS